MLMIGSDLIIEYPKINLVFLLPTNIKPWEKKLLFIFNKRKHRIWNTMQGENFNQRTFIEKTLGSRNTKSIKLTRYCWKLWKKRVPWNQSQGKLNTKKPFTRETKHTNTASKGKYTQRHQSQRKLNTKKPVPRETIQTESGPKEN